MSGDPALENAEADGRPGKGMPGEAAIAEKKPKVGCELSENTQFVSEYQCDVMHETSIQFDK